MNDIPHNPTSSFDSLFSRLALKEFLKNAMKDSIRELSTEFSEKNLWMRQDDYAKLYGISRSSLQRMISAGELTETTGAISQSPNGRILRFHRFYNPVSLKWEY